MDDPRHREAEALVANQGSRQRTEYVVASMLAAKQTDDMEKMIRQAVRDELKSLRYPPSKIPLEEMNDEIQLTDLPDNLIHALDEI